MSLCVEVQVYYWRIEAMTSAAAWQDVYICLYVYSSRRQNTALNRDEKQTDRQTDGQTDRHYN